MTIADKLAAIDAAKSAIKIAIENKGIPVGSAALESYASKVAQIGIGIVSGWVRPEDWLPLPAINEASNEFAGLLAISNDQSNYVALSAAGAYVVAWGDGTVESYASGATAQHQYNYADQALDGTLCARGYKQAVVRVTPQEGETFTSIRLNIRHSAMPARTYSVPWLDLAMGGAALSDIGIAQSGLATSTASVVRLGQCEQVRIARMTRTNCNWMFQNMSALQSVPMFSTTAVTSMIGMFLRCTSLRTIPPLETGNVTSMSQMFFECRSMAEVPLLNTSSVTSCASMFSGCEALRAVPPLNFASSTNMSNAFFGCTRLESVTDLNTVSATEMSSMFRGCSALRSVAGLSVAAGSTASKFSNIFDGCSSLASAPLQGAVFDISYANCNLSREAIVAIFQGLGVVTGGPTRAVTVTGNFGAAQLTEQDLSIATGKGWVVAR